MLIKKLFKALIIPLIILLTTRLAYAITLIPGGETIGIVVDYEGIIISGYYDFEIQGRTVNPKNKDVQIGDFIIAINQVPVNQSSDLIEQVGISLRNNQEVVLTINRGNTIITRQIEVYFDESTNSFKTGLYIRDSLTGIGTVTFYDPTSKTYAALGHKMSDLELDYDISIDAGSIFESYVVNVTKSQNNNPGEKIATIDKTQLLGSVRINSDFGVYGQYSANNFNDETKTIEIATRDEVKLGPATILTVIDGTTVESFEIEIIELKKQSQPETKGIVFKVTDDRLLNITNGIIQGMSGSPIIQNEKLIGSVTHVILNDVDYGYGLYIEWMLEENMRQ